MSGPHRANKKTLSDDLEGTSSRHRSSFPIKAFFAHLTSLADLLLRAGRALLDRPTDTELLPSDWWAAWAVARSLARSLVRFLSATAAVGRVGARRG